jgi:hypothetical protein
MATTPKKNFKNSSAVFAGKVIDEECTERKVLDQLHSLIPRVAIDYLPQIEQDFFIAS